MPLSCFLASLLFDPLEDLIDGARLETSAGTLTILDKPTRAVKYASGLVSRTQSKLYPFSS